MILEIEVDRPPLADSHRVIAAARADGSCPPSEETPWSDPLRDLAINLFVLGDTIGQNLQRLASAK